MPVARLSPAAEADVNEIWDNGKGDGAATSRPLRADLDATCTGIAEGRIHSLSAEAIRPGYREAACGSHMIYFRQDGDDIEVVRILHHSMDVDRHL